MKISKKDALEIAKKIKKCFNVYASGAFAHTDLSATEIAHLIHIAANHEHAQEAIEKYCNKIIGCI
jgi:predicted dinucleotide-binding enzyme